MHSPVPDNDTFTTPPSTPSMTVHPQLPNATLASLTPSISRKNSRPSSLRIQSLSHQDWLPDVIVSGSPGVASPPNGTSPNTNRLQKSPQAGSSPTPRSTPLIASATHVPASSLMASSPAINLGTQHTGRPSAGAPNGQHEKATRSPCFVHSQLENGASLTNWLRASPDSIGGPRSPHIHMDGSSTATSDYMSSPDDDVFERDDDSETAYGHASLTKQLADTAVGVREMSKQLGRARIHSHIQSVLIVTKAKDNRLIKLTREIALYLMTRPRKGLPRGLVVYVDAQLRHSRRFDAAGIERDHPELFMPFPRRRSSSTFSTTSSSTSLNGAMNGDYTPDAGQLRYWTAEMCSRTPHLFDFVVTLGGDGTVLFTSWLFQRIVPPVLPFALGSLGFLTNFDFADHQAAVDNALDNGLRVNLRMRFTCTVYRAVFPEKHARKGGKRLKAIKKADTGEIMMRDVERGGWEAIEGGMPEGMEAGSRDKEIMCFTTRPAESFEILNDLVVDRGPSPYVSQLELFADEHHLTTVQADGLCIATPTGSTAYSLSAGGSLVHPEIPSILITPLCPHTLSFRPMLLPDSMELRICVPFNSRSTAWASFDGRGRVELKQGDHIKVTASKYPFPTVCADRSSTDWFQSISRTLKWNERERQKSFVVVEENPAKERFKKSAKVPAPAAEVTEELVNGDEEDEVSDGEDSTDEDEGFDIDVVEDDAVSSTTKATKPIVAPAQDTLLQPHEHQLASEKTREDLHGAAANQTRAEAAARALAQGTSLSQPGGIFRSGLQSGIDSPDRFLSTHSHPPHSARHVAFATGTMSPLPSHGVSGGRPAHSPLAQPDRESLKTPTGADVRARPARRSRSRSREPRQYPPPPPTRTFAVYGQDESESESNASGDDIP